MSQTRSRLPRTKKSDRKREASDGFVDSGRSPLQSGIDFTEAVGKTIASIRYTHGDPECQVLEVHFTDGTLFSFELVPLVVLRVDYMESRCGELQRIRRYGKFPDEKILIE